ncbi:sulfotransferase 2A1-like [Glandiceps talaboti]
MASSSPKNSLPSQLYTYEGFNFSDRFQPLDFLKQHRANQLSVRDDDVFVVSFPKSGTSWVLHALVTMYDDWGLLDLSDRRIAPLLDYYYRALDSPGVLGEATKKFLASGSDIPSPRLFKTHLPPCLFPVDWTKKKCKVIYIARNPKDVCVSSYKFFGAFFHRLKGSMGETKPSWDEYVRDFTNGDVFNGPWIKHVIEWRKFGIENNVLHITYEDMKIDLKSVLEKIAKFIGRPLSPGQLDHVVSACSIEEMRKHAMKELDFDDEVYNFEENPFFRKGEVGNWKEHFSVAQSELLDEKIGKVLKDKGIIFGR